MKAFVVAIFASLIMTGSAFAWGGSSGRGGFGGGGFHGGGEVGHFGGEVHVTPHESFHAEGHVETPHVEHFEGHGAGHEGHFEGPRWGHEETEEPHAGSRFGWRWPYWVSPPNYPIRNCQGYLQMYYATHNYYYWQLYNGCVNGY
jgi:hypothetical protein